MGYDGDMSPVRLASLHAFVVSGDAPLDAMREWVGVELSRQAIVFRERLKMMSPIRWAPDATPPSCFLRGAPAALPSVGGWLHAPNPSSLDHTHAQQLMRALCDGLRDAFAERYPTGHLLLIGRNAQIASEVARATLVFRPLAGTGHWVQEPVSVSYLPPSLRMDRWMVEWDRPASLNVVLGILRARAFLPWEHLFAPARAADLDARMPAAPAAPPKPRM